MCYFTSKWATVCRNSCCLWLWQLGFGVCFTAGCHIKFPLFPDPLSNRSVPHDGRKHKTVVFSQSNTRKSTSYKNCQSSPSAAADSLADSSGQRRTSPFNGIERSLSCAVVPKTKSRAFPLTFPTACYCTSRRPLRKDIHYPSCFQRQNGCLSKRK